MNHPQESVSIRIFSVVATLAAACRTEAQQRDFLSSIKSEISQGPDVLTLCIIIGILITAALAVALFFIRSSSRTTNTEENGTESHSLRSGGESEQIVSTHAVIPLVHPTTPEKRRDQDAADELDRLLSEEPEDTH